MSADRPDIPTAIKREVRRRCFYGCVMCGMPIFDYDHIVEYSKVKTHEAENITLLCRPHHSAKTTNMLPVEKVIAANEAPYNAGRELTSGYILESFIGTDYVVRLGTNLISNELREGKSRMAALNVDGGVVLGAHVVDGELLIRADLRDALNRRVLRIFDNEIVYSTAKWDIVWTSNRLTMWDASRKIGLEMHFERDGLSIPRGEFWANGIHFSIADGILRVDNVTLEYNSIHGAGIYAGDPARKPRLYALDLGDHFPRFSEGAKTQGLTPQGPFLT